MKNKAFICSVMQSWKYLTERKMILKTFPEQDRFSSFLTVSGWHQRSACSRTGCSRIFLLIPISCIQNGFAYLALVIALYFNPAFKRFHVLLQWALIALATTTIVLYFVFNGSAGLSSPLGMVTKGIELALIVALVFDMGR